LFTIINNSYIIKLNTSANYLNRMIVAKNISLSLLKIVTLHLDQAGAKVQKNRCLRT